MSDETKKEIWKILFGDEVMPESSENSIEEWSDVLNTLIKIKNEINPLLESLYELRRSNNE